MPNLSSVGITNGVPNTGTGNVSTIDALMALVGEVQASPTANTMLDRLKALATALNSTLTVTPFGSRRITPVNDTFAVASSVYGGGYCFGGLRTIATGLPAGTLFTPTVRLRTLYRNFVTTGSLYCLFFRLNPAASIFTDAALHRLEAADSAKLVNFSVMNQLSGQLTDTGGSTGGAWEWQLTGPTFAVDGAPGNLYYALLSGGSIQFNAGVSIDEAVDGVY